MNIESITSPPSPKGMPRFRLAALMVLLVALETGARAQSSGIAPVPTTPAKLPEPAVDATSGVAPAPLPAPTPALPPPTPDPTVPLGIYGATTAPAAGLAEGMIEEETGNNLEGAMNQYQEIIAKFDAQRADAANAVFRLAECYRKLGRVDESKVLYSRVLREFNDVPNLATPSQKRLFEATGQAPSTAQYSTRLNSVVSRNSNGNQAAQNQNNPNNYRMDPALMARYGLSPRYGSASTAGGASAGSSGVAGGMSPELAKRYGLTGAYAETIPAAPAKPRRADLLSIPVSSPTIEAETDVSRARQQLREAKENHKRLFRQKSLVASTNPELMPSSLVSDPRFMQFKEELTEVKFKSDVGLGNTPEERQANKDRSVTAARERLERYKSEAVLPALQIEVNFAEIQLREAENALEEAERRLEDLKKASEKSSSEKNGETEQKF